MAPVDISLVQLPDGANLGVLHERVRKRFDASDKAMQAYVPGWNGLYSDYRGYKDWKADMRGRRDRPDRDDGLREAQRVFGTELHIPYAFSTVETIAPRAVSNRPKMLILPDGPASANNVENMKELVDRQQEQIAYELTLAEVAKSGHIFGLGWQKSDWRRDVRASLRLVMDPTGQWVEQPYDRVIHDDPDAKQVDIMDLFWDPFAHDVLSCRYLIQRSWRDTEYVASKLMPNGEAPPEWENPAGLLVTDVEGMATPQRYDEAHEERLMAGGMRDTTTSDRDLHEIWEYWELDGQARVITVLDREVPVSIAQHPYWHGELPFQCFRPATQGNGQLPGIGEIEPIVDLQNEINQLRSQRRDNAAFVLQKMWAFHDGFVDQNDLQAFPGAGIPVSGDPREMLMPIEFGDIPNSGYQEEAQLQADIERATGISDTVAGTGDASQTATGVQLVQAAANQRIAQKTRRIEIELCAPAARQWVSLNQQMILSKPFPRAAQPTPLEPGKKYDVVTLTPAELAGNFIVLPEGGSIAPENVPQKRQDAMMILEAFKGDMTIDQQVLAAHFLREFDIKNPETWFTPAQFVPPIFLDILLKDFEGVPLTQEVIEEAYQMAMQFHQKQVSGEPDVPEAGPHPDGELEGPPSGG